MADIELTTTEQLPEATRIKYKDMGDGTYALIIQVGGGAVSVSEPVSVDDNGGSLTVDDGGLSLTVDGTVAVSAVAGNVTVVDGGGSLTVDDGGTTLGVDDAGGSLSVDDAGGSLTVDGSVSVTGTPTVDINSPVDAIVDSVVGITVPHYEIHEGDTFQSSYKSPNASPVADDGTIELLITTAAKTAHIVFDVACGGDAELVVIEAPTVNDPGTPLVEHNMNRASGTAATVTAAHTPTVVGGTTIHNSFIPGGTKQQAQGGRLRVDTEWIFKTSTAYLIRGINRAGAAQPMSAGAQWYEE